MVDVALVSWPEDAERLAQLRVNGAPRLLLVASSQPPPEVTDCLEDWIRIPADEAELRARRDALSRRATHHAEHPELDEDGLLRFRGSWVALPPVDAALTRTLLERFGSVVDRETLIRRAWKGEVRGRNALDVHILRLRRRVAPLGLEIRTVRSRGYLLQAAPRQVDATTPV
ncbi:MAG TPA: winged helix-turn-helix domain-containing protein [Egibacteraceae bacterium]